MAEGLEAAHLLERGLDEAVIDQIPGVPSLCCHRMSLLPLPLKSLGFTITAAVPLMLQLARVPESPVLSSLMKSVQTVDTIILPPNTEPKVAVPSGVGWLIVTLSDKPAQLLLDSGAK